MTTVSCDVQQTLWRAGLPRVGLRSSPIKPTALCLIERGAWF